MNSIWKKLIITCLIFVILSLTVTACPAPPQNSGDQVPVVTLKRVAPNNLDYPGDTVTGSAAPEQAAFICNHNARVFVPAGAVGEVTTVTLKLLTEAPASVTSDKESASQVTMVSNLYDAGPDNTAFLKPVEITIAYDDALLPEGANEAEIGPIFFDGRNWVPLERYVDTANNLVSFKTSSFPGFLWGLALPTTKLGWAAVVAGGAALYAGWEYVLKPRIYRDPAYWGNAYKYITPKDPAVQKYAAMSKVQLNNKKGMVEIGDLLNDPLSISDLSENEGYIQVTDGQGPPVQLTYEKADLWQMPSDYFRNGMVGDCKNVANAFASVFRSYGVKTKCVSGFQDGSPHQWMEFIVGGEPYYLGSHGEIRHLENAFEEYRLNCPSEPTGSQGFMWDENGQEPYRQQWWLTELMVNIYTEKPYPGGKVILDIFATKGPALEIDVVVVDPDGKEEFFSGVTDKETGSYLITLTIPEDAPVGSWFVSAENTERNLKGMDSFEIRENEIYVKVLQDVYEPGAVALVDIQVLPPAVTDLRLEGKGEVWTTDENGYANIAFYIQEDTAPGEYEVTAIASEFGLTGTDTYTVAAAELEKTDLTAAYFYMVLMREYNGPEGADSGIWTLGAGGAMFGDWEGEYFNAENSADISDRSGPDAQHLTVVSQRTMHLKYTIRLTPDMDHADLIYTYTQTDGAETSVNVINVPRYDGLFPGVKLLGSSGYVCYFLKGTSLAGHILSCKAVSSNYALTRYWTNENSYILIVLAAADKNEDMPIRYSSITG